MNTIPKLPNPFDAIFDRGQDHLKKITQPKRRKATSKMKREFEKHLKKLTKNK